MSKKRTFWRALCQEFWSLATAFAYEVIYQRPASELFGGLCQRIEQEVATRARTLTQRTEQLEFNSQTDRKRKTLMDIITNKSNESHN